MATLSERRVWITGASSGIGAATARVLAANGAHAILSARRAEQLRNIACKIENDGGKTEIHPLDVTDRTAVARLGEQLDADGGVDILINNAGLMPLAPLLEGRVDEWERTIDVNLKGLLFVIHAVLPGMAERKRGHIVNIGSVAGRFAFPGAAVYCGTKFAVRAISDSLRREMIQYGVRVTDIEPGAVATDLKDSIGHDPSREAATGKGGLYDPDADILEPEDIANAILYAVSQPAHVNVSELLIRPTIQER
ncbi:MAG: SDR family oxidoreductase [Gammaproteobacteria bacterium]|nr:SDR family oxidoreductase [Gammaproteobacteria bacterium]MBA3731294.1 SDR family oxidoreductase [Gammaproteobacteria bacterium]